MRPDTMFHLGFSKDCITPFELLADKTVATYHRASEEHLLQEVVNVGYTAVLGELDLLYHLPRDRLQRGQSQQDLAKPSPCVVLSVANVIFQVHLDGRAETFPQSVVIRGVLSLLTWIWYRSLLILSMSVSPLALGSKKTMAFKQANSESSM